MKIRGNGPLLMMAGNLFFGILPILVKWATQLGYSPVEETFFRFLFAGAAIGVLWAWGWQSLKPVNLSVLIWRGIFGGISILTYFISLEFTSSGKGTLLNYTYILWANLFSVFFLKRKAPRGFFPLLLMAATGVWLVLDIQFDRFNWGDLAGVVSGFTGGVSILATKEARRTDNALTVFGSFTFFSLVLSGFLLLLGPLLGNWNTSMSAWIFPDLKGWGVLLGMGAVAMAAQMFFTEAFGFASLAVGTLLALSVPVLASFFGWWILGEPLTPHFILGTVLVLIPCGIFGSQENPRRKKTAN